MTDIKTVYQNGTHETTAFLYRRKVNDEENDDEANEAR